MIRRLLGVLILLTEAAFIITEVDFVRYNQHQHIVDIFQILDLIFSAYYCVEVSLRIIGNGYVVLISSGRGIVGWWVELYILFSDWWLLAKSSCI